MKTTTSYWKDRWNQCAQQSGSDYETDRGTSVRITELEARSARQFLEAVDPRPTDRVLDVGCGTGVNIVPIAGLVAHVTGTDLSEAMINRARVRLDREGLSNVTLAVADATRMPYPSESFHKVICTSVLQYLNDDECEAALREMVRVAAAGGILVLHVKNRTSLYGLSREMIQRVARLLGRQVTPDYYRPRRWYESALGRAGGRILDFDSFGIFNFVPMPQQLVRALLRWETRWVRSKRLRRYGVNFKLTVRIEKPASQSRPKGGRSESVLP